MSLSTKSSIFHQKNWLASKNWNVHPTRFVFHRAVETCDLQRLHGRTHRTAPMKSIGIRGPIEKLMKQMGMDPASWPGMWLNRPTGFHRFFGVRLYQLYYHLYHIHLCTSLTSLYKLITYEKDGCKKSSLRRFGCSYRSLIAGRSSCPRKYCRMITLLFFAMSSHADYIVLYPPIDNAPFSIHFRSF